MAHLGDRVGARRLLWIALFAWSVLLCVLALTRDRWSFAAVLVLVEIAGGSIDTAMNAEASHRLVDNPVGAGALPRAVQRRRAHRRGRRRARHPRRRLLALGLARPSRWWPWRSACGPSPPTRAPPCSRRTAGTAGIAAGAPRGPPVPAPPPGRAPGAPGRVRPGRDHRGRRRHLGRALPAQPPGHRRAARRRGLRRRPAGGGHHPRRRGVTCSAGSPPGRRSSPAVVWPVPASCSSRSRPVSGVAALGLALGAGGASLFWPLVMSTVSRMASQVVSAVGAFTAAGYVGWVAGAPIVGLGLADPRAGPRAPGPGPGLLRGRRVHPAEPKRAHGPTGCQRVAWADRHDPAEHRDARRPQGPEPQNSSSTCARRSGPSSSTR